MKRLFALFVALTFLLSTGSAQKPSDDPQRLVGKTTPQLKVEEWITPAPTARGTWMMFEIWATWCSYCEEFVPRLNTIQAKLSDKVAIVALSNEDPALIRQFISSNAVKYPVARMAEGAILKQLGVLIPGVPFVILYDPQGIVRWVGTPDTGTDSFVRWLERIVR